MRFFLSLLLSVTLIPACACSVSAAASGTVFESEQGQATIDPPSSSENEAQNNTPEQNNTASGMDWEAANTASSPASQSTGFTVVIDPGHQGSWVDMSAQEPVAPGSSETKAKATTGTQGTYSGVPEYEVNLQVSLALQKELTARGYRVIMTRTDNDTAISNKERAELATREGADITVRIHANGDSSSSASGALTMAPTSGNAYLEQNIVEKSNTLASCIINHYCAVTGLENLGILSADNMTGTNWSTVPVTILEMGFMSNQNDDLYITNSANHEAMVCSIADGIDEYFSTVEPQNAALGKHLENLTATLETQYLNALEKAGESWAVAVMDLNTENYCTIHADQPAAAAGIIKTFIMGTVFENLVYGNSPDIISGDYKSTLKPLLVQMISADSDNAANTLVKLLGNGDFSTGASLVNQFCQEHGYSSTKLNEQLPEQNSSSSLTSASDCCRILAEIYHGTLVNETASKEMLTILKQQTQKNGIPAGISEGIETINQPGEQKNNTGTLYVENDAAIVLHSTHPYVICILSSGVKDSSSAQTAMTNISKSVYEYFISSNSQ